jgi:phosphoglycolate phosphatase-like HAD superfamily hydrolase
MKPLNQSSGIDRRALISTLALLPAFSSALLPVATQAQVTQSGVLPSWNDGAAKQAIFDFVRATIDRSNPNYVFPEDRIAVFDQDGTLWVEHPMYTQVVYCLERVPAVVEKKPELKNVEPFKTVLSRNREAIAKLPMRDLEKILAATLTGMSVEEFNGEAKKWIETAKHARWNRPYTELVYQPMLEVLRYLHDNAYKTYIVTGGGQDFVRVYAEKVYGIPPEQVVGTAGGTKFGYAKDGKPPDQRGEAPAQRQQCRQGGGNSPHDRPPALRCIRQLDRRPADAGVDWCRRRRAAEDARPTRRRRARIRLWPGPRAARQQGRHLHACALRRGEEEGLDGDQHEE